MANSDIQEIVAGIWRWERRPRGSVQASSAAGRVTPSRSGSDLLLLDPPVIGEGDPALEGAGRPCPRPRLDPRHDALPHPQLRMTFAAPPQARRQRSTDIHVSRHDSGRVRLRSRQRRRPRRRPRATSPIQAAGSQQPSRFQPSMPRLRRRGRRDGRWRTARLGRPARQRRLATVVAPRYLSLFSELADLISTTSS